MSKRLATAVGVLAVLTMAAWFAYKANAQPNRSTLPLGGFRQTDPTPRPQPPPQDNPFRGKVVVVLGKNHIDMAMKDVETRLLGTRQFLVGVEVEVTDPALVKPLLPGKTQWVPVEDVTRIIELPQK